MKYLFDKKIKIEKITENEYLFYLKEEKEKNIFFSLYLKINDDDFIKECDFAVTVNNNDNYFLNSVEFYQEIKKNYVIKENKKNFFLKIRKTIEEGKKIIYLIKDEEFNNFFNQFLSNLSKQKIYSFIDYNFYNIKKIEEVYSLRKVIFDKNLEKLFSLYIYLLGFKQNEKKLDKIKKYAIIYI